MMIMKKLDVILATETNDGELIFNSGLLSDVARTVGGYTTQTVTGGWIDDGKTYTEQNLMVTIASDDQLSLEHALAKMLRFNFNYGKQLATSVQVGTDFFIVSINDVRTDESYYNIARRIVGGLK